MSFHIYKSVTERIVRELESGVAPWTKPWKDNKCGGAMPQNAITGRPYSGINIPILWCAADDGGYPSHRWLTFRQATVANATVRKGERGTQVVFTKRITRDVDGEEQLVSMLKTFYVFNVSQIEGLPEEPIPTIDPTVGYDPIEAFVTATNADIRIGGNRACFVPSYDFIAMPPREAFPDVADFYATELHELGHWSGHERRLNRDLKNRFGSEAYAAEELIAELTAAFLCAHLGISGQLQHAEYIASWIKLLRSDDRAIFTAASKATEAANHIRSYSEKVSEDIE